jgi:antirestriction protein ArdC
MSTATATTAVDSKLEAAVQSLVANELTKDNAILPWRSPTMMGVGHHNMVTKNIYSGGNALHTGLTKMTKNFESKAWMTFNQGQHMDVFVRKGEQGTAIQLWATKDKKDEPNQHPAIELSGKKPEKTRLEAVQNSGQRSAGFYRTIHVFNADQFEWNGVERPRFDASPRMAVDPVVAVRSAIATRMPAIVVGKEEGYDALRDQIVMLPSDQYRTPYHEAWSLATSAAFATASEGRMNRRVPLATTPDLAREQIRAESAATVLMGALGYDNYGHGERANSIHNWSTLIANRDVLVTNEIRQGGKIARFLLNTERAHA